MRLHTLALGFSVLLLASTASAGVTSYTVHLKASSGLPGFPGGDGGSPFPSFDAGFPGAGDGGSEASGDGTFSYDDTTKKLTGTVTHTVAKPSGSKLAIPGASPLDQAKTIAEFPAASPITVDATLKAEEETELLKGNVHFAVVETMGGIEGALVPGTGDADGGTAGEVDAGTSTDTDSGSPDPGSNPGTNPGSGEDKPLPDASTGDDDSDSTNNADTSSSDSSGCSVRAPSTSHSVAAGASLVGLIGLAFVARRKRRS